MSNIDDFEDPFPHIQESVIIEIPPVKEDNDENETNIYAIYIDDEILGYVTTEKDAKQYMYKVAHKLKGTAYLQDNYRGVVIDDNDYEDYLEVLGYHAWMPVRIYKTLYRIYYTPIKRITVSLKEYNSY